MTVSNTDSPVKIYTGTATEYPIPFDYISDNDILVTLYNTTTGAATDQTKDVHYTISDETVIYSEAPGSVYNVVIRRVTPYTQEASFGPGEEPPLSTYESSFDKLTMLAQDLNERLERCIMFPDSYSGTVFELPNPTGNAGRLLRINEDGTGLDVLAVSESGQATEVTEYVTTDELSQLHESGVVKADLVKLHAMTLSAVEANLLDADTRKIGDILTKTSGSTMGAITAVAVGSYLKSAGVGKLPAWGKMSLGDTGVAVDNFTFTSTGSLSITGVGFKPSLVIFFGVYEDTLSFGVSTASKSRSVRIVLGTDNATRSSSYCFSLGDNTGIADVIATLTSMDSDGFTLNVSKVSGTANVSYIAFP